MLQIDRHFYFLRAENLAVFTERVLRNTAQNPNIGRPDLLWNELSESCQNLRRTLGNPALKRKLRTDAIREREAGLLKILDRMAGHIESTVTFKSDVLSSGFHLHADQAKMETRRKQRMTEKMARLAVVSC